MDFIQETPNAAMSIQILWGVLLAASALYLTWMALKLVSTALKCVAVGLLVYGLLTPATELKSQVDAALVNGRTALTQLLDQNEQNTHPVIDDETQHARVEDAGLDFIAQLALSAVSQAQGKSLESHNATLRP